jgi:membrane-associated protein
LHLLDPQALISFFGPWMVWGVAAILLIETGTIIASFLPGDSILFLLGISLAVTPVMPLPLALLVVAVAAVLGSQAGYGIGVLLGDALWKRQKKTWFYNEEVVTRTHEFFEKHGSRAIVMARFIPVLRALVPMLAGVSKMSAGRFAVFNAIGGVLWAAGITLAGFGLGHVEFVRKYLDICILGVVGLSALPLVIEVARKVLPRFMKSQSKENTEKVAE